MHDASNNPENGSRRLILQIVVCVTETIQKKSTRSSRLNRRVSGTISAHATAAPTAAVTNKVQRAEASKLVPENRCNAISTFRSSRGLQCPMPAAGSRRPQSPASTFFELGATEDLFMQDQIRSMIEEQDPLGFWPLCFMKNYPFS